MKILATLLCFICACTAHAQLSTNQKTQVAGMINTAITPLKKTITADSIRINNLVATNQARQVIIDSLTNRIEAYKAAIPPGALYQFDPLYFIRLSNGQISLKQ